MYCRTHGAKVPPAPAPPLWPLDEPPLGIRPPTASPTPGRAPARGSRIRLDGRPAMKVEPPTLPAVCTRSIGLPTPPRASARNSSGWMIPSKASGALPDHRARRCPTIRTRRPGGPAGPPHGRGRPSRRRPVVSCGASDRRPRPRIAQPSFPSSRATRLCWSPCPFVAWASARSAEPFMIRSGRLDDSDQAFDHDGVGAERPPRRVDVSVFGQAQCFAQDDLLRAEDRRQFDHVDGATVVTGLAGGTGWSTGTM